MYCYAYIVHSAACFQRKKNFDDDVACSVAYGHSGFVLCGTMREIRQGLLDHRSACSCTGSVIGVLEHLWPLQRLGLQAHVQLQM